MNYPNIDLNGLATIEAVRRTGSIIGAAAQLNLSQPTLSNRLRRLREELGDPLFVRTPTGMQPTPFADQFCKHVAGALAEIDRGLRGKDKFDPLKESRNFTIIVNDITEVLLLPSAIERCKTEAPGVTLTTLFLSDTETELALSEGQADLAIGYFPSISSALMQRHVLDTQYVVIAANSHPSIGEKISKRDFLAARYVVVEARGTGHHAIEKALQREGVAGQIGVRVSGFLSLPLIVASSDMLATVPWQLAHFMRESTEIKMMPHPLKLPAFEIRQFWHARYHDDPGNKWLRSFLSDLYKPIAAESLS